MALFSRRGSSDPTPTPAGDSPEIGAPEPAAQEPAAQEPAPAVNISVGTFRGLGSEAAPAPAAAPDAAAIAAAANAPRPLPLAPIAPPAQTQTVEGIIDNVLLRETLARLEAGATNEQFLGVLRQVLQGHLILRVHGNAQEQLSAGKPLEISILRDGENSYLMAFSSGAALKAAESTATVPETSAIAQAVPAVITQVVDGGFQGMVIDHASAPHRVVFPTEVLRKALADADPTLLVKNLLAVPHADGVEPKLADALERSSLWVAANEGPDGAAGIAEMRGAGGLRFLQLFTHPLEVIALGRGDRPVPFPPANLARVLTEQPGIAGVLIDPAGPSAVIGRAALAGVMALAEQPATEV